MENTDLSLGWRQAWVLDVDGVLVTIFFLLNTSTTFVGPYSKVDGMLTIFNFLHRNQELYNMSQSYEINEASNIVLFGLNT